MLQHRLSRQHQCPCLRPVDCDRGQGGLADPRCHRSHPDINPETPTEDDREEGVKDGIRLRRGKFSDGQGQGAPRTGTFVEDNPQPDARTDSKDQNRDWTSLDTAKGPKQPGGWRRGKRNGELDDPTETTDEIHIEFDPCLQPGEGFEITLCFDEQLDENDLIHFTPSDAKGAGIGGGDITASETISVADIIKILAGLAGSAASKTIGSGKRIPNRERRTAIAKLVASDEPLRSMVRELIGGETDLTKVFDEKGIASVVNAVGPELVIRTMGTAKLAENIKAMGLSDDLREALD